MLEQLETLAKTAETELGQLDTSSALSAWNSKYIGRKGQIPLMLRQVSQLPKEERPTFGQRANQLKKALEAAYEQKASAVKSAEMEQSMAEGAIDVTLPGRPLSRGRLHPSTQTLRRIYQIWADMGFQIYRSRDVETDEMNFQFLNFPPHHPAREMQDTFYTTNPDLLLRTHTSPGQIRAMREFCPEPIRVILPGMCYRNEQITARSEIQFHQVEGLAVGRGIRFSDLKGTLINFTNRLYGQGRPVRFRASHFPFTEPSAEMDVECFLCDGKGCRICKYAGWLEILGCGMVHPNVLRNGGYDPTEFSGFAFGMGPERITMLRHGIEDIRYFWGNDMRFLQQF
ncbi:phenylalanine--tRNA ligase subunit alpha [Anaerolineales bacterium HSG6]|nr:phenylalanine--tRNA ligase subunit alpha [Anaerolineales bacterium HSG6]MDM8532370.1 phenylalanine--tRNA ligase subunit alpha [Anaerolineales bacterium HSG25]